MRRLIAKLSLHLVLVSAAAVPAQAQTSLAADSAGAADAATRFLAAFDSLQWEPFRNFLADDVTMFFPFTQVPQRADGRAAVERVFSGFFSSARSAREQAGRPAVQGLQIRDVHVQMLAPGAGVVSFHVGEARMARRSVGMSRAADGRWLVRHWHASNIAAPTPQPAASDSAATGTGRERRPPRR